MRKILAIGVGGVLLGAVLLMGTAWSQQVQMHQAPIQHGQSMG